MSKQKVEVQKKLKENMMDEKNLVTVNKVYFSFIWQEPITGMKFRTVFDPILKKLVSADCKNKDEEIEEKSHCSENGIYAQARFILDLDPKSFVQENLGLRFKKAHEKGFWVNFADDVALVLEKIDPFFNGKKVSNSN